MPHIIDIVKYEMQILLRSRKPSASVFASESFVSPYACATVCVHIPLLSVCLMRILLPWFGFVNLYRQMSDSNKKHLLLLQYCV